MPNNLVSIIIPIYKTEKYLRECLLSVQQQTFKELEVILVNNATPDNAMEIAQKFVRADSRFTIIEHAINRGPGGARNSGVQAATGEYLRFLDSDDQLPVDSIARVHQLAVQSRADIVIGNMGWLQTGGIVSVSDIDERLRLWQLEGQENVRGLPAQMFLPGSITNRFFKCDLITGNKISCLEKNAWDDIVFALATWFFSQRIAFTTEIVYHRTRREDANNPSITQMFTSKAYYDRDAIIAEVYYLALSNYSRNYEILDLAIYQLHRMFGTTQKMLTQADPEISDEINQVWFPQHREKHQLYLDSLRAIKRLKLDL